MAATDKDEMDADSKLMLADMRGDIRLINDRHSRYTDDVKRIEERHLRDMTRIDGRLQGHDSKIDGLEAHNLLKQGERQGLLLSGKILWTLAGGSILAIGAALVKVAGL